MPDHEPAQLSFAQERLWFLEQLQPGSAAYHLCRAVRIRGPLELRALQTSWNEIQRRHESLRTRFVTIDGRPRQIVEPPKSVRISRVDLRRFAASKRESAAARLIAERIRQAFDLSRGPLFRVRLLRLRDNDHVLALIIHHLIADAWSMGIIFRELWTFYEAERTGRTRGRLPVVRCRYRDYAAWQRASAGDGRKQDLAYWKEKLTHAPVLDLPTDRPRPAVPSLRGAKVSIELPESLTGALNDLSRPNGATLFMTLLAALQSLLCRWSGQDDITVGVPVANRDHADLENTVGLFVSTLVLRTDLSAAPTFRNLLGRVREVCLAADAHKSIPFEWLVQELSPQRGVDRHPLFQVMLVFQNTPSQSMSPEGLRLQGLEPDSVASPFDLSLYLRERRGLLIGYLEYATDLFDRITIERMAGHFRNLLQGIAANPDRSIATLPLLSAVEKKQLLVQWNDTAAPYPKNVCIHQLFETQAKRAPDAVALESGDTKITYRELNGHANALAHELQRLGVGPERLVGILAERSPETIAAVLAILKAGGAYVPLDPGYPRERLRFMLAEAGIEIVLAQQKYAAELSDVLSNVILIDNLLRDPPGAAANLRLCAGPESAAYVIYTSGSEGIPKGVIGLHRGTINRFAWMWKTYPFEPGEKICQKTSLSFVDSVWEIFGALLQGVPSILVPDAVVKDPRLLVDRLAEHGATRLVLVPSLLKEIVEHEGNLRRRLAKLKYCFSSGEALSKDVAERFRRMLPRCRLINLYGSTEVAADVTYYEVRNDDGSSTVPIGRPIANTEIYLLDDHMQPVPLGARGEIYVGGAGPARGYLHRPELTAQRFIPNPFSAEKDARLYRTGDLARYRADGNLEFLGRADEQVKIRGCRVEMGEIESTLGSHPDVRECLVTIQSAACETDNPKSAIQNPKYNALTAYVVARENPPTAAELRSFLKARLPDFMVPAGFVFLDRMPLLPNGKIDRRALPQSAPAPELRGGTAREPRTEVEFLVAEIWRQVLKIESAGMDDNFFELGGHSLLAAEVAGRLRDTFGRPLSVRDIFDAPTIGEMASMIAGGIKENGQADLPPIRPTRRKRNPPLAPGQAPLFMISQLFGGGDFLNLPYAFRLDGRLDVAALRRSIDEVIRRHEILRAGFVDSASGPKQFIRASSKAGLPVIDLSRWPEQQRESKLEQISRRDAAQTFDLEKPPLARFKLVRVAESQHILLVTLHHIIGDQWSMGVLRRELAALYEAFSRGLPSPSSELPIQFADFARWQMETLKNGGFAPQISYWRKQLESPSLRLEFRRRGESKQPPRYLSRRRAFELDGALFARIKAFARERNCTPFMIFMAALSVLLHRHTGSIDIRIGTLVANRGRPGTDLLIGYFVNALVLRMRIRRSMTFAGVLGQVRKTCLGAYAHQDLPFECLETLLEKKKGKRDAPLYQVMLNYRNQSTPTLEANGLSIASWDGTHRAADPGVAISRLDVNIHLRELSTKLTGAVNYKSDLFDDATIEGFIADYTAILEQMVTRPETRIGEETIRETR